MMARVAPSSPALHLSVVQGRVLDRNEQFLVDRAEIRLLDGGWLSLTRSGQARFTLPHPVSSDEIVHPWLAPAASTFNRWLGRQIIHGGIVAKGGKALALVGHSEGGKSSLLAWLSAAAEVEILADDLVVLDGRTVFAGPRCIDLRPGSASAIAVADKRRVVRDATRLRLELPPCRPTAQLVGTVILDWGPDGEPTIQRVTPTQGVTALLPHAQSSAQSPSRVGLLDLLGLPIWTLTRPKTWDVMPDIASKLAMLLAPA